MAGTALLGLDPNSETHRMSRIGLGESRGESIPGRKELGSVGPEEQGGQRQEVPGLVGHGVRAAA